MMLPPTSVKRKSAAHVAVDEPGMFEPELPQERRLQVVDMDRVLGDVQPDLVGLADDLPRP